MAVKVGEAFVDVTARLDGYNKGLGQAQTRLQSFSTKAAGATNSLSSGFMALGRALPLIGMASFVGIMGKAFQVTAEQQKAEAQLNAVLKSTQGVAGLTAKELKNLASELQGASTFGDELIIRSEALLLTFTSIGRDVFPRAEQAILDMASAMGTDLQSATIQVGKALNDPIQGVSALSRVGVQLSEENKNLIKTFVKTGEVAKAQSIILGELETQFGGAAEAAANTLGGSLQQLQNTIGDLFEQTGFGFADTLTSAFQSLNGVLQKSAPLFEAIGAVLSAMLNLFVEAITLLYEFAQIIGEVVGPALKALWNGLTTATSAISDFIDEIRGIESIQVNMEVLADETPAERAAQQKRMQISKDWLKARDEAQKFAKDMANAIESPAQAIARVQEENLSKLENFRKRRLISEEQYNAAKVAINQDADNKILELRRQRHEQEMQMANESLSKATEFLGLIGEAFAVSEQNRLMEIDQRKQKKLNELQVTFEQERDNILSTVKNKKKQDIAIKKLEEQKAKQEQQINEKSDKEKAKIQRRAFERQKAFRIVETIMATGQAIMSALSAPWPASIAFAALAGVMGAVQLGIIASQKPPAMADGGIVTGPTFAEIGEAGPEAVFPLTGPRGAKTREMFANDLVNAIAGQQDRVTTEAAGIVPEGQDMTFNVQVNMGGDQFFTTITQGIENRQILIDENALVKG